MANPLFKISNTQILTQFLHNCVNDLIGRKHVNFDGYSSDIEWTKEDYTEALKFIQNLYRQRIANSEDFQKKIDSLSPNLQESINDCFEIRKNEITQALVKEYLLKSEKELVENIDWKLKWVMGSSSLATLREPLLQVDLHCFKKEKETPRKTVNFEMNLEGVEQLIVDLQQVKAKLSEET